jgi:hypothetical protein
MSNERRYKRIEIQMRSRTSNMIVAPRFGKPRLSLVHRRPKTFPAISMADGAINICSRDSPNYITRRGCRHPRDWIAWRWWQANPSNGSRPAMECISPGMMQPLRQWLRGTCRPFSGIQAAASSPMAPVSGLVDGWMDGKWSKAAGRNLTCLTRGSSCDCHGPKFQRRPNYFVRLDWSNLTPS